MHITHVAIWVSDLEGMKDFYQKYFAVHVSTRYHNAKKNFTSYFLSFESGARLELMHRPDRLSAKQESALGYAHLAISVGSEERVNALTALMRKEQIVITGEPRWTGDGYYESVILDPEGNHIELTV